VKKYQKEFDKGNKASIAVISTPLVTQSIIVKMT
jgi:hypothetical protein